MDEQYKKLLYATYKYLGIRARSEKEIRDYLKKKSFYAKVSEGEERQHLESVINSIVESLKRQKFLNDEEFARIWVENRSKHKAWRFIKFELKQKGISEDIIDTFESKTQNKDSESALSLAEKRVQRLKNEPLQKRKEKLFRFLSSKGYDYDTIKEVIDHVLPK